MANLRAMADQLEAARTEIDRMRRVAVDDRGRAGLALAANDTLWSGTVAQRDETINQLRARVVELEQESAELTARLAASRDRAAALSDRRGLPSDG